MSSEHSSYSHTHIHIPLFRCLRSQVLWSFTHTVTFPFTGVYWTYEVCSNDETDLCISYHWHFVPLISGGYVSLRHVALQRTIYLWISHDKPVDMRYRRWSKKVIKMFVDTSRNPISQSVIISIMSQYVYHVILQNLVHTSVSAVVDGCQQEPNLLPTTLPIRGT